MFPILSAEAHEALCRRCGASCHTPILLGGKTVILPEIHCRFLARDTDGKALCTVYENRFERAPWCKTAREAFETDGLAHDCPYARSIPGYRGRHWANPEERARMLPLIRRQLIEHGLPSQNDPADVLPILEADGSRWTYTATPDGTRFLFRKRSD